MYIGRFAPTPSGDLHFGSLVTAIASYLDAKKVEGRWLLKIDDIDKQRVKNDSIQSILKSLESLNLFWDLTESYQSHRLEEYEFYFEKLSEMNQTYRCNCTRKYLSDYAKLGEDGYVYPGFCKFKYLKNHDSCATRLEVNTIPIVVEDQIQGKLSQNLTKEIGDFVIKRNDGQFSYQFSVCVDNKLDKITNVVRGADLLSSTLRQVYLQNLLDFDIPKFSHIPIATINKKKISKSDDYKILIKNNQKDIWVRVLNFLNQPISKNVSQMNLEEIIEHAITNWAIEKISPLDSIDIS
jgi:glutamyl-Q tRNA(Asp) synthetase